MKKDAVDDILEQWSDERPELDTASLGVVIRVTSLNRAFLRQATEALAPLDLEPGLWRIEISARDAAGAAFEAEARLNVKAPG